MKPLKQDPVEDVGIDAIEFYFPNNYVDQADLEQFNGVSSGKYTIGLGQTEMGFCADNEDIVSISMTVTKKLLDTYKIPTESIGCLVVGTETLIDKSKSVKTTLMELFEENTDIEGVDVKNACFGGAQALLHAIDWVHVNHPYEKRNAIVVVADIAVYEDGPARCTGGAGAIALLIRPNAAIPIDRVFAACHMKNCWDFYKPITAITSEYPKVDGTNSLSSYMEALKTSYANFKDKVLRISGADVKITDFDAVFMHSPFTKLVQKGLAVLHYTDTKPKMNGNATELDESDRAQMTKMITMSTDVWKSKTDPYLLFNRRIGNMYTPSLFAQLLAYLASDDCITSLTADKQLLFFAYGSGFASAIFPARVSHSSQNLENIRQVAISAVKRLDDRRRFTAEEFTEILKMRERFLQINVPAQPESLNSDLALFPKTFYLQNVDKMYRRTYNLHEDTQVKSNGVSH